MDPWQVLLLLLPLLGAPPRNAHVHRVRREGWPPSLASQVLLILLVLLVVLILLIQLVLLILLILLVLLILCMVLILCTLYTLQRRRHCSSWPSDSPTCHPRCRCLPYWLITGQGRRFRTCPVTRQQLTRMWSLRKVHLP